jgi:chromosome segregation ATPase
MTATERLKAARGGVKLAKDSLDGIRQQARQAMRDRVRAEAAFRAAERCPQDLAPAREELERQRKASDFLAAAVEDAKELLFLCECSADDALRDIEMAALCGPELLLPIWD